MSERVPLIEGPEPAGPYGSGLMLEAVSVPASAAELERLIPEHLMERFACRPLLIEEHRLVVAMKDPTDVLAIDELRLVTGLEVVPVAEPLSNRRLLTLTGLRARARLTGPLAQVQLTQSYFNPYHEALETVYIFPLSAAAAVTGLRMRVGDRVVEGTIEEKKQARRTYRQGKQQGHQTALLEQERDNVFTMTVGNVPPGAQVELELTYCERLEMDESELTFHLPLVVAPRYIPGAELEGQQQGRGCVRDTDQVPDASRITPPLLPPGLRLNQTLHIEVELEHGTRPLSHLGCSQHCTLTRFGERRSLVSLSNEAELLNRDFVLRFSLSDEHLRPQLLTCGDHFMLLFTPPALVRGSVQNRDVVLLLDRSGSMDGIKMESARRAARTFLSSLGEGDRFALALFDDKLQLYQQGEWQQRGTLEEALRWLEQHAQAQGGTEVLPAVDWALSLPTTQHQCVLLITDGQVGNESAVYRSIQESEGKARFFTFGIDSAVNDAFLRQVARLGRGTCELVAPGEKLEAAFERLSREIGQPLITELNVIDEGLHFDRESLTPNPIPDLYAARPVCLTGRCRGQGGVRLTGRLNGQPWSQPVDSETSLNPALPVLWARQRIADLEDQLRIGNPTEQTDLRTDLLNLALKYGLVSSSTSFVLVDRSQVVNPGGEGRSQVLAVHLPAQWEPTAGIAGVRLDISAQEFGALDFEPEGPEELAPEELLQLIEERPIVRVVELILHEAIKRQATHVHVVPEERSLAVWFRVGGNLEEAMSPPKHLQAALLARFRYLAGLDCEQKSVPQLGRFSLTYEDKEYAISLSCYPGENGDRLVVQLQPLVVTPRPLEELGFTPELRQRLVEMLSRRKGLLLLHSPSDSLRWLTLASLLHYFAADPRRSVAVWDPNWRPSMPGLTHLRPLGGMSRDRWLTSLLHQDLDLLGVSGLDSHDEWQAVQELVEAGTLVVASWGGDAPLPQWDRVRGYLGVLHINEVPTLCQCEAWKGERQQRCPTCYNTGVRGHQVVAELLQPG